VQEGDLLAEIDPRPFQVALEQMEGNSPRSSAVEQCAVDFAAMTSWRRGRHCVAASRHAERHGGQLEGALRADQAQIDNEKLQLVYCKITAPITDAWD